MQQSPHQEFAASQKRFISISECLALFTFSAGITVLLANGLWCVVLMHTMSEGADTHLTFSNVVYAGVTLNP